MGNNRHLVPRPEAGRLHNHGLATTPFPSPAHAVRHLGAMQSQEYSLARWSVAQRCASATAAAVDRAIADGEILRTHVLRPTWHFVHRNDIRWLLELTGPRIQRMTTHRYGQLGLDSRTLSRAAEVTARQLEGGHALTRREIAAALQNAGIATDAQRLPHMLMHMELDGLICSGAPRAQETASERRPRTTTEQTYALLEERAPHATWLPRDEALAELTSRYFTSRGPATLRDFQWWSTLTMSDVKRGAELARRELEEIELNGRSYLQGSASISAVIQRPTAHLIQEFDEYLVGYTESRSLCDPFSLLPPGGTLARAVLVDGFVAGTWRTPAGTRSVEMQLLRPLDGAERDAAEHSAAACGSFLFGDRD